MRPNYHPAQTLLAAARREGGSAERQCELLIEHAAADGAIRAAFQRELAQGGLTESGFAVASVLLGHEPESLLRADLAVEAGLSVMQATSALTRLEMSGLVRRQRDAVDRRLVWLRLTPEGKAKVTAALRRYVKGAAVVAAALDEVDLTASLNLSAKLRKGAALLAREEPVVSVI